MPVRTFFLFVLLGGAIFYSYVAFIDLDFLTRTGRLGPGFFPRIIGVCAIVLVLWVMIDHFRGHGGLVSEEGSFQDVALLMSLAVGYAVCLRLFGGFIATVIYLGIVLSLLNRGKHRQNLILTLAIPGGVYLLFDRVLNANMPPALFAFSF